MATRTDELVGAAAARDAARTAALEARAAARLRIELNKAAIKRHAATGRTVIVDIRDFIS